LIEVKTKIKSLTVVHRDSKKEEKNFPYNKDYEIFKKYSANKCYVGCGILASWQVPDPAAIQP